MATCTQLYSPNRRRGNMVDNTLNEEEQSEELEPTPYQNTYRRDLEEPTFNEEEEADNIDDPVEATRQQLAQHEGLEKELLGAKLSVEAKKHDIQELPKTEEELSEFKEKYPDVYDVVETISTLQANERVREIEDKLDGLRVKEQEAVVQTAAKQLLNMHPDFEVLKESDVFLSWLDEQPSNISDGIYKNNIDVQWAARVIDLFKVDNGIKIPKARNKSKSTKGPQSSQRKNDAAQAVTKTNTKRSLDQFQDDKKVWSIQEISKLKPWEYEKVEKDIDKAVKEGRVVDSVE